jgi:tetratricopeptide (TPR) repeat protein
LLVTVVVVVILGVAWWWRALSSPAIAGLEPVAPSVPADQPERREAMEVADRLLREFPHSPESLYARGIILFRHGFNEEAAKTWKACLQLVPDLAPAYEFLGLEAFQRGDNEQAIDFLSKAVQFDPQSAAAGLYLGEALNNLGRMDEAIPVLEQFLKVSPHTAEPYFQLGQAYLYLRAYDRAKEYHQAALREDPMFAQAWFGLALACERLGEKDQAKEYREKHQSVISRGRMAEQRRVRSGRSEAEAREALADAYRTAAKVYTGQGKAEAASDCVNKASALDLQSPMPDAGGAGSAGPGRWPVRRDR